MTHTRRVVVFALVSLVGSLSAGTLPVGATTSAQLQSKALSISNLPAGWSVDNSNDSGTTSSPGCLKNLKVTGKHDVKITASFVQGSGVPALKEDIETGPSVSSRYHQFTTQMNSCKNFSYTSDGQSATASIGAMSFPKEGSQSAAYSVSVTSQGETAGLDVVIFKVGKYVADIIYEDLGAPDVTQTEAYVSEAIHKIEGKAITPSPSN